MVRTPKAWMASSLTDVLARPILGPLISTAMKSSSMSAATVSHSSSWLTRCSTSETPRPATASCIASHELRSPVTSIRTQLKVTLRRPNRDDWAVIAQHVLAEDERLKEAVADLVELARLDEGAAAADLVEVDLDEIMLETRT